MANNSKAKPVKVPGGKAKKIPNGSKMANTPPIRAPLKTRC